MPWASDKQPPLPPLPPLPAFPPLPAEPPAPVVPPFGVVPPLPPDAGPPVPPLPPAHLSQLPPAPPVLGVFPLSSEPHASDAPAPKTTNVAEISKDRKLNFILPGSSRMPSAREAPGEPSSF